MNNDTLQQALSALLNTINGTVQRTTDAVATYGPEALELAGRYLQVQAVAELGVGFAMAGGAIAMGFLARRLGRKTVDSETLRRDLEIPYGIATGLAVIICVITTCATLDRVADTRNWVRAVDHRLALASFGIDALTAQRGQRR